VNIRIKLILQESRVIGLHRRRWSYESIFIQLFVVGSERRTCCETECIIGLQGHPTSLILAPIESAYATSYWSSIVTRSYILPRFRDIAGFLRRATAPEFWECSPWTRFPLLWLRGAKTKLIIRVIAFELTQHIRPRCLNVTDRQTDDMR